MIKSVSEQNSPYFASISSNHNIILLTAAAKNSIVARSGSGSNREADGL